MASVGFREVFAILHMLDRAELEAAGVISAGRAGDKDWHRFNNDIGTFVLKLPAAHLEKLIALIEANHKGIAA